MGCTSHYNRREEGVLETMGKGRALCPERTVRAEFYAETPQQRVAKFDILIRETVMAEGKAPHGPGLRHSWR